MSNETHTPTSEPFGLRLLSFQAMQTANQRSDHCRANLQQMKIRGQADGRSELLERDTTQDVQEQVVMYPYSDMAVASGLAGPVFTAIFAVSPV